MGEQCPISGGNLMVGGDIPEFCREHCETLWSNAVAEVQTDGPYDIYKQYEYLGDSGSCRHVNTDLEFSHDGLQSFDDSPTRSYAIVDQCVSCEQEFGEQGYKFDCPYN